MVKKNKTIIFQHACSNMQLKRQTIKTRCQINAKEVKLSNYPSIFRIKNVHRLMERECGEFRGLF